MASESWTAFSDLGSLLQALSAVLPRGELFPREVIRISDLPGWLAAPIPNEKRADLELLSQQCGWQAQFSGQLRGVKVPLAGLLYGLFRYVDINEEALRGGYPQQREYVLGVQNKDQARLVLEILTENLTRGIRVRPVEVPVARPGRNGAAPLELLWVVHGPVPRPALEQAWRVWWGPAARGRDHNHLYTEWPYEFSVPAECLERIDWGTQGALILLSREAPQQVTVSVPEGSKRLEDLIAVGEVQVRQQEVVSLPAAGPGAASFPLQLRLVRNPRPLTPAERIRDLEREIRAKQEAIRRLEEEAEDDPYLPPAYDPLFLYHANPGEIPEELRRLLLECCDREELRSLRYQRIDAASFPPGAVPRGQALHVLTTASVLAGGSREGQSLWLREYAPYEGQVYQLRQDWANFGLRLFLPDDGRRLELYPDLKPGREAAWKLGQGLLPPTAKQSLARGWGGRQRPHRCSDSCILLVPTGTSTLCACRLRVDLFQPLISAFNWECSVEVATPDPRTVQGESARARARLQEALKRDLTSSVQQAIDQQLPARQEELIKDLERIAGELNERLGQRTEIQAHLDQLGTQLNAIRDLLNGLRSARDKLAALLGQVSRDVKQCRTDFDATQKLAEDLDRLRKSISHLTLPVPRKNKRKTPDRGGGHAGVR
jgi:hypothetical protein